MIRGKELVNIIVISIILAFSITLLSSSKLFLIVLASIFAVILINLIAKKITAYFYESEVETRIWQFKRYGIKPSQHFKKEFAAGAFFPILIRFILYPLGGFTWMASLVFDEKSRSYKAAKRHGMYSYTEISENEIAVIAGWGILSTLAFAVLGYLIGFTEFAKLSIWFAFFNMIPISELDGNKIYFGNKVLWSFLATITLIGLAYTFLLI